MYLDGHLKPPQSNKNTKLGKPLLIFVTSMSQTCGCRCLTRPYEQSKFCLTFPTISLILNTFFCVARALHLLLTKTSLHALRRNPELSSTSQTPSGLDKRVYCFVVRFMPRSLTTFALQNAKCSLLAHFGNCYLFHEFRAFHSP